MEWLRDQVAIVTGGGRGIGRAIALEFARQGAKVVVNDNGAELDGTGSSAEPADTCVSAITRAGGVACANYESVSTMQGAEAAVQTAITTYGRLDILVTCHGVLRDRMIFNMTEPEWDALLQGNLKGTFAICKYASRVFREQHAGRIVTFASLSGLVGNSGQGNEGAAAAAIAGFTKAIARELADHNTTANCVAPVARTRMTASIPRDADDRRAQRGIDRTAAPPADSLGAPEEIAPFVSFLASEIAAEITGHTFTVHGRRIALLSEPRLIRTLYKSAGYWTVDELLEALPDVYSDVPNPAPAAVVASEAELQNAGT